CYFGLGSAYTDLGEVRKAIDYYKKALNLFKNSHDLEREGNCYNALGSAYKDLGEVRKAIDYHEKALENFKGTNYLKQKANSYNGLGHAYTDLGMFHLAIDYYEKALTIFKDISYLKGISVSHSHLGSAYRELGMFQRAIEHHDKALKINEDNNDLKGMLSCYINLGNVYDDLGIFQTGIEYREKALKILETIEIFPVKAIGHMNIANSYRHIQEFHTAIEHYKKTLELFLFIGDPKGKANCYLNIGHVYDDLGEVQKSIECYEKTLEIYDNLKNKSGIISCHMSLGIANYRIGKIQRAIDHLKHSLKIVKKTNERSLEIHSNFVLGQIQYNINNLIQAYDHFEQAIALSEKTGKELVEERDKLGIYARFSGGYQSMISLCVDLSKNESVDASEYREKAFNYTERSKSRAFLDLLAATKIQPSKDLPEECYELLAEEEKCLSRIRELQIRDVRSGITPVEPGELEKLDEQLNSLYKKLKKYIPEYVFIRSGKPLALKNLQKLLLQQGDHTVLVEYFVTAKKIFIFVVTPDELHMKSIPLEEEELQDYLGDYDAQIKFKGEMGYSWLDVSKYLIAPIAEKLQDKGLIYFVPHGLLHYLPLHALDLNGDPIIKKHPVAYLPSASLLILSKKKGSGHLQDCVTFGVPSPKDKEKSKKLFREEAQQVAVRFNGIAYIDTDNKKPTKELVLSTLDNDILHFSCHGIFDEKEPLNSHVKLYNGEELTAREIFSLRLNTELFTLSACETGINDRRPGDELIGFTRALFYAGAASVIVSLWKVDPGPTKCLMLKFYELLHAGENKVTALQKAQTFIMEKNPDLYHWAPFVLVGDWE
ncbi:MAG: tetratricopeptide repeat protein, partial [Candidatus Hodarchaeota archaeon]